MASQIIEILRDEGILGLLKGSLKYLYGLVAVLSYVFTTLLSSILSRDENIWLFLSTDSSGFEFSDNTKYLYLYLNEEHAQERPVWITKSEKTKLELRKQGFETYIAGSWKHWLLALRAKHVVISNDVDMATFGLIGGTNIVQLWHGTPLKRLDTVEYDSTLPWKLKSHLLEYDYLCISSPEIEDRMGKNFEASNVIVTGYPRNDILFRDFRGSKIGTSQDLLNDLQSLSPGISVIGYFPTFRENSNEISPFEQDRLEEFLEESNALLLVKPHRYMDVVVDESNRIIQVPPEVDPYPLFKYIDVMITDYSSIFYDFLLLERPIVFYPYDLEDYREQRGFTVDYREEIPGYAAESFDELVNHLKLALTEDQYNQQRTRVKEKVFAHYDGKSSARIYNFVK